MWAELQAFKVGWLKNHVTVKPLNPYTQFYRIKGGGGSGPPTDNF